MEDVKTKMLRGLNFFNQEIYKELLPRLVGAKYYHSETEFWLPLVSGISILRTRINTYEFPPLFCPDMSDRLSEPNCKEILELQQVELGRVARDLTENNAKIEAAVQAAIKKGKRFSIQTTDMREATDKEWEKAEQIIEKFQLFNVPCVSVRTAKTKEDMVIDEFD